MVASTNIRSQKGVTLIELIIVLALLGIVIAVAWPMIGFSSNVHKTTVREFDMQSDMRLASEQLTQYLRHMTVGTIYTDDQYRPGGVADRADRFNYLALEEENGKTVLVDWRWVEGEGHIKHIIAEPDSDLSYGLSFYKHDMDENVVYFELNGYRPGSNTPVTTVVSEIIGLNSVFIQDFSSPSQPGSVLAYRTTPAPGTETEEIGGDGHIAMVLVLDISNSMDEMMGTGDNRQRRITHLKDKTKGLLNRLSEIDNAKIEVAIIPYATTANGNHQFLDIAERKDDLTAAVNSLQTPGGMAGGTNTGDGLRRAYHLIKQHDANQPDDTEVLYYMLLLMDGNPTFYTVDAFHRDNPGNYITDDRPITYSNGHHWYYGFRNSWSTTRTWYTEWSYFSNMIAGSGQYVPANNVQNSLNYAKHIASTLYANDPHNLDITSYVIGFSDIGAEIDRARELAEGPGASLGGTYYEAADAVALEETFETIVNTFPADLWHIYLPVPGN
ncbi:VWA domain-containing protein [Anoxynatronum sibiricum]|uniref:VWA domain-containing protein n=1 Tax=Anoxynatronum sibiricum TaxID=210623 RepID=A0ABU9VQ85_9CLOT